MDELEELRAQELELRAKLDEIAKLKAKALHNKQLKEQEQERLKALEKEVVLLVRSLSGSNVLVYQSAFRWDLDELIRKNRASYNNQNSAIPLAKWEEFHENLQKLPNAQLRWESDEV